MRRKLPVVLACLLLSFGMLFSQTGKLDSLLTSLGNLKKDTSTLVTYSQICHICKGEDCQKFAQMGIKQAEDLLKTERNAQIQNRILSYKAFYLRIIAKYYKGRNQYSKAIEIYQKVIPIYQHIQDTANIEFVNIKIADILYTVVGPGRTFDSLNGRLNYFEKRNNSKYTTLYLKELAFLFRKTGNKEKARKYFARCKKIYDNAGLNKESAEILYEMAWTVESDSLIFYLSRYIALPDSLRQQHTGSSLFSLTDEYIYSGILDSALLYNKRSFEFARKIEMDSLRVGDAYISLGKIYFKKKEFETAEYYFKHGLDLIKENIIVYVWRLNDIADMFFAENKYQKSLRYSIESEKLVHYNEDPGMELEIYVLQHKIYSKLGDYKKAYSYLLKTTELQDSIRKLDQSAILDQSEIKAQFAKENAIRKAEQEKKDTINKQEKKTQTIVRNSLIAGAFLLLIVLGLILRAYRLKQQTNAALAIKNELIARQKHLVDEKQKEILDSINYAKRLQQAILPDQEFISKHVKENFILYRPKDIVAGDFYWAEKIGDKFFIAAADSTGHGVPGALVSVVCSTALNRAVNEFQISDCGKILDKARELIIETFEKGNSFVRDGMDISLLCLDTKNKRIHWSGAHNPLWYVSGGVLHALNPDKQPVGKMEDMKPFKTQEIQWKADTSFYLFTDGFADQFGGPNGKKFKYKQFEELLLSLHTQPMSEQKNTIEKVFDKWMGELEQVDDVCVIGLRN